MKRRNLVKLLIALGISVYAVTLILSGFTNSKVKAEDYYTNWTTMVADLSGGSPYQQYQLFPKLIKTSETSDGNYIIAWQDGRTNDPSHHLNWGEVYVNKLDASGNILWTTTGVPVATGSWDKELKGVVSDNSGGAIVLWSDFAYSGEDMIGEYARIQKIDSDGDLVWGGTDGIAITTGSGTSVRGNSIVPDGSGGAYVSFDYGNMNSGSFGAYVQRINSSGTLLWGSGNGVAIVSGMPVSPNIRLALDGTSGVVVAWYDTSAGHDSPNIWVTKLDTSGSNNWGGNHAISDTNNSKGYPQVVSDNFGGAYVLWTDSRSGHAQVFGRHLYSNYWTNWWPPEGTTLSEGSLSKAVSDNKSGVIFTASVSLGGSFYRNVVRQIDQDPNSNWTDFDNTSGVDVSSSTTQYGNADIAVGSNGDAFVTWMDEVGGNEVDVHVQKYNDSGRPQWGSNGIMVVANGIQPVVMADDTGGVVNVWSTTEQPNTNVVARRISPNYDLYSQDTAAPVIDNYSSYLVWQQDLSHLQVTHHVSNNASNRFLVVSVYYLDNSRTHSISSVTYNSVSLTKLAATATYIYDWAVPHIETWYLNNPPGGTHDVVINWDGTINVQAVGVVSFRGVDQTNPIYDYGCRKSTRGGTTPNIDIETTDHTLVLASPQIHWAMSSDPSINQLWAQYTGSDSFYGGIKAGVNGSDQMQWMTGGLGSNWNICALAVNGGVAAGNIDTYYHILNLQSGIEAYDSNGLRVMAGDPTGLNGTAETVNLRSSAGYFASATANVTADRNWPNVLGNTDIGGGKSYVNSLDSEAGVNGHHALYIPQVSGSSGAHICPIVSQLGDITDSCAGGYDVASGSENISTVMFGQQAYWKVTGLTGNTGGMNYTVAPPEPTEVYTVSTNDDLLRTVDVTTGNTIYVSSITLAGHTVNGATGLAKNPATGEYWALLKINNPYMELVKLDLDTGVATDVGNTGDRFASLAFSTNGNTLYGVTGDGANIPATLYSLDQSDASPTFIMTLGDGTDGEALGMTDSNVLYHISGWKNDSDPSTRVIETIDPVTHTVTDVPKSGYDYTNISSLFYLSASSEFIAGTGINELLYVHPDGQVDYIAPLDHTPKGLVLKETGVTPTPTPTSTPTVTPTYPPSCVGTVQARFTAGDLGYVKTGSYSETVLNGQTHQFSWSAYTNNNPSSTFVGSVTLIKPDNSTITLASASEEAISLPAPTGTYTLEARTSGGQLCDRAQIQVTVDPQPCEIITGNGTVIENPDNPSCPVTPTPTGTTTPTVTPTPSVTPTPDVQDLYIHDPGNGHFIVAKMTVDLSVGRDWGAMTAYSRTKDEFGAGNAAILHYPGGAANIPGLVGGSFKLYVRRSANDFIVRVCPGVAESTELNTQCADGVDLKVGTTGQYTLAPVTIQGDDYWEISGVTGTGAITISNGISDTLTRLQVSTASNHTVKYGTPYGLTASGNTTAIEFDPAGHAWDLSTIALTDITLEDDGVAKTLAASAGVDIWGVDINTSNDTITFTAPSSGTDYIAAGSEIVVKIGTNTSGGTHQIVNPDTVNSYEVYIKNITPSLTETGAAQIPIIDDDTVNITGYLQTFITFDIDTASTNSDCDAQGGSLPCNSHGGSLDGAGYVVDLGEMTTSTVNVSGSTALHADGLTGDINSIWFDLSTNADGGAVVKAYSLNNALLGPSSSTIPSVGSGQVQITPGSSLYGIQNRAGDLKTETSGFINIASDCSGSSGDTYYCSVGGSSGRTIFDSFGAPVDAARVQFRVGASPNSQNPTGTYTDELTFIATPTF